MRNAENRYNNNNSKYLLKSGFIISPFFFQDTNPQKKHLLCVIFSEVQLVLVFLSPLVFLSSPSPSISQVGWKYWWIISFRAKKSLQENSSRLWREAWPAQYFHRWFEYWQRSMLTIFSTEAKHLKKILWCWYLCSKQSNAKSCT